MIDNLICVVCESPLFSNEEKEAEICNACLGNAESLNNNKNKEEIDDANGDNPIAVDRIINRTRPLNFGDFEQELEDEE